MFTSFYSFCSLHLHSPSIQNISSYPYHSTFSAVVNTLYCSYSAICNFLAVLCCFFVAFLVLLLYFSSHPPLCIWIVRYSRLFVSHLLPLANRFRNIYSNNNNIWNKPIFIDVMQMVVAFQTKSSGKKASFKHLFGSCINLLPARIERV